MEEKIEIIYEDKNFIALNKPAGMLVHQTAKGEEKTLVDFVIKKFPEVKKVGDEPKIRPGIVHRLDKDTSGVILIARNQKYFDYLKNIFQEHKIKKKYLALAWGIPNHKKGVIEKSISLKPGTIKRTVHQGKMEKSAITFYKILKTFSSDFKNSPNFNAKEKEVSLLEVEPKTGRTHQIRIHLASIGHPVVGDIIYGKKKNNFPELKRQFLHAESIEFNASENKKIKIEVELPQDLENILKNLKEIK